MEQMPMAAKKTTEINEWRVQGKTVNCRVNMQRASASCLGDCHFTEICVHVLRSPGFYVHSIKICMLAKVKK